MSNINNPNHPVVLFIPEAGTYPYMRGLAVLGDAIVKQGGTLLVTHDTGQMLRSPIMAIYRTSVKVTAKERAKIRRVTERYFKSVLGKYRFSSIELSDLVDDQLMNEINSLTDKVQGDLRKIYFRGFPVGKMAEFDFILETKFPYYSKLSDPHKELYLQYIKNTALAIAITDRICERYKPSLFLTFNEYAQCQAVRYSAEMHNVRRMALTYPVNLNIDTSRFSIWEFTYRHWIADHIRKWNEWKNIPIKEKDVIASWRDSVFRMYGSGSHIFSSRKNNDPAIIFNDLKLDPKRRTIVVYTSSQEERNCAGVVMKIWKESDYAIDVFPNQIEWLLWLREYFARRADVQVIVRVHPREGSKQHGFDSQHLLQMKAKFKENTPNFAFVWPDDPVSSYDLMELADICLIAWSTIGQEAARLGIPVLSCVSNMYYPDDDFIQTANTRKEYKRKLNLILQMKHTWQHLTKAIRFYHWRTFIPSLDLSKTVPKDFDDDTIWPESPKSKVKIINDILSGRQDLIEYNTKKWQESLPKNAVFQETKAMKKGIRYLLDSVFYPPRPPRRVTTGFLIARRLWRELTGQNLPITRTEMPFKDYQLKCTDDISQINNLIKKTKKDSKLRVIVADGTNAILVNRGKLLHRMSPMVVRLGKLYDSIRE